MATSCTVRFVKDAHNEPEPILVEFNHGRVSSQLPPDMKFGMFSHAEENDHRLVLVAETNLATYLGTNFDAQALEPKISRTYLGVLDKKTRKMEVREVKKFHMKYQQREDTPSENNKADTMDWSQKNDALSMAFGSKKKVRAVKTKHEIKPENIELAMTKISRDTAVQDLSNLDEYHVSDIVPSINWAATKPEDVFNLDDIITKEDLHLLGETENVQSLMNYTEEDLNMWRTNGWHLDFVLRRLPSLPTKEHRRRNKAAMLMYTETLMKLLKFKYTDYRKKEPLLELKLPTPIEVKVLDNFTQSSIAKLSNKVVRSAPQRLKDKLCCHVIILGLIIDNYQFPLNEIPIEGRIGQSKIYALTKALGARVEQRHQSGTDMKIATACLKIPLVRVSDRQAPRKRKRV